MGSLESISRLNLPQHLATRLEELTRREQVGVLEPDERRELEILVETNQLFSQLRVKAANLLTAQPNASGNIPRVVRNQLPVFEVPTSTPAIDPEAVRRFLQESIF